MAWEEVVTWEAAVVLDHTIEVDDFAIHVIVYIYIGIVSNGSFLI